MDIRAKMSDGGVFVFPLAHLISIYANPEKPGTCYLLTHNRNPVVAMPEAQVSPVIAAYRAMEEAETARLSSRFSLLNKGNAALAAPPGRILDLTGSQIALIESFVAPDKPGVVQYRETPVTLDPPIAPTDRPPPPSALKAGRPVAF